MNLIDRYVTEVGKNLPLLKGREDIEKELRSTLEDMLEERAEKAGRPADEAMEIELLKEYGAPQKVAATYNPQPYLIGPRLFPFFLMVLKIVMTVVVTVMLVLNGIQAVTESPFMGAEFLRIVGGGLQEVISAAIMAFGNIVLVFVILERVLPDKEIGELNDEKEWDPTQLALAPNPDTVKRGDLIAEIVFTFVGLAFINGIFSTSIFSDAFLKFVPWINGVFLAGIVLDIYLLRNAAWTTLTRAIKILIEAVSIVITVIIIRTPNLINFSIEFLQDAPENTSVNLEMLTGIINLSISISLVVGFIVSAVEIAKAIYALFISIQRKKYA